VFAPPSACGFADAARHFEVEGCAVAWKRALAQAGLGLTDLSVPVRLLHHRRIDRIQAMGLARKGRAPASRRVTAKDGKLPINPSAASNPKGHPIGATGVSMHALGHAAHRHCRRMQVRMRGSAAWLLREYGGNRR
jgi:acetyl-CoA acetyltransferase